MAIPSWRRPRQGRGEYLSDDSTTRGRSAPPFGISGDLVSNFFERLGLGLPDSAADQGVAWFQMKKICRSGPVFALGVPEVRPGVRLVRALVFRKPYVAI